MTETKKETKGFKVLGVFSAQVKAFSGKGNLTALVVGTNGGYALYGTTNLVTCGLLADSQRKIRTPQGLAGALQANFGVKIPLYTGKEQCLQALVEHKVPASQLGPEHIIADVPAKSANKTGTGGRSRESIIGL